MKPTKMSIHPHMTAQAKAAGHGKMTTAHKEPVVPGVKASSKPEKGMKDCPTGY